MHAFAVAAILAASACAPSKPRETRITVGGPAQVAPVVDLKATPPDSAYSPPDVGWPRQPDPSEMEIDLDDEEDDAGGPIDVAAEPQPSSAAASGPVLQTTILEPLRDPRAQKSPRARALVETETKLVERLFAATSKTSPDRPKLIRRLAQAYAEIAGAARREHDDAAVTTALQEAIRYHTLLQTEYPKNCLHFNARNPSQSTGCGDETAYLLGYDYERLGQVLMARKSYLMLVQSWPQSHYVPHAYLAFGEMFFAEAQKNPAILALAEQSYKQVLKFPLPDNRVYGYALLRLGEVYQKKGEGAKARSTFQKLNQLTVQYRGLDAVSLPASLIKRTSP